MCPYSKFCWIFGFQIALLAIGTNSYGRRKTWTFEIQSVETTTSDPNIIDLELAVERVSRGVYAISGAFDLKTDVVEGDNNQVEALVYRSSDGVEEYKPIPFKMTRQHVYDAFNGYYKDMLMDTLKDCSDLPVFKDKITPPIEKKLYTLTQCQFTRDGFADHVATGFYKVVLYGTGECDWGITVIAKVEPDI
ncbi:uncharacterized protein LOC106090371 [Stomoxys calcitrans]|uniref:uncharacterized protein LOC106090371 n=1 Tax=Stomoxys calcitrans TaxID=35570 RepID=UPI0027E2EC3D|nr:uncharacterized protein LOC106090371 [Stomoxys calcitrans]